MQSVNVKMIKQWKRWLIPFGLFVLLALGLHAFGVESEDGGGVLRSRVYNLRNISSEQARGLFSQLNIGKSYNTLTPDVLIITSNVGSDLSMATEIINLLDQTPPVQIRTLIAATDGRPLPPRDEFVGTLASISVGSLSDAPSKDAENPAIIDVLGDELIAIANENIMTQIEAAIADWQQQHPMTTPESSIISASTSKLEKPQDESQALKEAETSEETAEPNVPELSPEPNNLVEVAEAPTQIEPIVPEESLEEIAEQVSESLSDDLPAEALSEQAELPAITETDISSDTEPTEEPEEDFLTEGLLQALADAQQDSDQTPDESVAEEASEETIPELAIDAAKIEEPTEPQDDLMDRMQELLAKSKAEEEQMTSAQEEPAAIEEAQTTQDSEPSPEVGDTLQAELNFLRQRLAELEAMTAEGPGLIAEAPVQDTTPEPVHSDHSKIQVAKAVQTEPQFAPELSEKELDTVIDLPQDVELEALVDLVGKQLGLNYFYDPAILKGQSVKLKIHGGKIKVRETYALLESVLRQKGFVMTRRGPLVTIIKTEDAAQAAKLGDVEIREPDDPIAPGTLIVKTKFTLENISTTAAQNMLTQLQLGLTNGFQEIPETGTLIVTDYSYRMEEIKNVLDMIDVPGEAKEYEFRTLKYMKPSEIVPKLQELTKQLEGVSLQISAPTATEAPETRTVTTRDPKTGRTTTKQVPVSTSRPAKPAAEEPQEDALYIDTDDRTNRILMAGKADQIALVNELIDALDVPQYDLKVVREYIIHNVEASEVIDVLNELALATVTVSTSKEDSKTTSPTPESSRTTRARTTPTPRTSTASRSETGDQPYISVRPATNSLLVNATLEQHKAIELVIAHVDVVQKDQRTIRQYEIQYVDTQEIIDTLTDLGIIAPQQPSRDSARDRSSRSSRQTANRAPQQAQAGAEGEVPLSLPTVEGGSEKDITAEQPQISVLETTNSLLVYATPRQHDAIALVIAHADRVPETTSTPYVVYALENQDPVTLAEVLTKLIQETVEENQKTSTPESKIQTGPAAGQTAKLPTLEEQNIRVIPDESSYSLIVYANKRNQQWISELIRELDEYRPQVLLDCTLVEISQDDSFKYDMDIVSKTYSGLTLQPGSPIGTVGGADFSANRLADARSTSGDFTGFFNSEMIQALLETVQTNGYGRIMARPKILVNDNQEGEITTKNTTAIAQISSQTQVPDQGNAITTQDVTFTDYEEGVTLNIKPHISQGEMLRLEITLNRTDFTLKPDVQITGTEGDASFPSPPDRLSTDVVTVATVPDGTTIILGGLESIDQTKSNSKIPILGDLPIVGGLFRGIDNSGDQGRLYVFVKANIIRPGDQVEGIEDIRRVSEKYREEFEEMEEKFQAMQDWPGIDQQPLDPVKVLEEDDFSPEEVSKDGFVIEEKWPSDDDKG